MTIYEYTTEVRYYETDQMKIVHHSNYIRYCECARLAFLNHIGLDFAAFERSGYVSPVLSVSLNFRSPALYGDTVTVKTHIKQFKGARIWFGYEIVNQNGKLLADGESVHTFCTDGLRPVNLAKHRPEIYEKLSQAAR